MFILDTESNDALVFGTYGIKRPKFAPAKKVRVDRKRQSQLGCRRVNFGEKVKFESVFLD